MNFNEILQLIIAVGVWAIVLVLSYGLFIASDRDQGGM